MTRLPPNKIRFDDRTWTVTFNETDGYRFDGYDHDDQEAFAVLAGQDTDWAVTVIRGVNDAAKRGLIRDVEQAVTVIRRTRKVRSRLDLSRITEVTVLVCASHEQDRTILKKIASNPNTPGDILRRLVDSPESRVRSAALRNPSLPADATTAADLTATELRSRLTVTDDQELLAAHLDDRRVTVRRAVAKNPNTPVGWLDDHILDRDAKVAFHAAENLSLPEETRARVLAEWCEEGGGTGGRDEAVGVWVRRGEFPDRLHEIADVAVGRGSDLIVGYLMLRNDIPEQLKDTLRDWMHRHMEKRLARARTERRF